MAPIHDTDIAADRWAKAEWEQYELWEKIELKLRRRKWLWITATALVFFSLSAIPIVLDHAPKWTALSLSRRLADQISAMKRDAAVQHQAFRIRFAGGGSTAFVIESGSSCKGAAWTLARAGDLRPGTADFAVVSPAKGEALGVPGLIEGLCYDPLTGSEFVAKTDSLVGFGLISAGDLAERRIDRLTVVLVRGPSAELSFE